MVEVCLLRKKEDERFRERERQREYKEWFVLLFTFM
jgi:hypothetical protein